MDGITVYTTPRCPHCKQPSTIIVKTSQFKDWRAGAYIQDAFPEMDVEQRELIKTGFHARCWDVVFPKNNQLF